MPDVLRVLVMVSSLHLLLWWVQSGPQIVLKGQVGTDRR